MKSLSRIMLAAGCLSLTASGWAKDTGAAFLKIGAGARSVAMASAFTGVADDASAIYWNPAGIASVPKRQIMATHSDWLLDMNYDFAGYVQPTRAGAVGFGLSYLSQGNLEGRGENREKTSDFTGSDLCGTVSFSRRNRLGGLGMNIKFVQQKLESNQATGFAFDFGGKLSKPGSALSFGAALQNVGPGMRFIENKYSLPLTLATGAGYKIGRSLTLSMDVRRRLYTGNTSVSVGTEYWLLNAVALRTGYLSRIGSFSKTTSSLSNNTDNRLDSLTALGAGIGLRLGSYQIDYALTPYGDLGSTQRISLTANF